MIVSTISVYNDLAIDFWNLCLVSFRSDHYCHDPFCCFFLSVLQSLEQS